MVSMLNRKGTLKWGSDTFGKSLARYKVMQAINYRRGNYTKWKVPDWFLADVCIENDYDFGTATLLMYGYGLEGWDED